MQVLGGGKKESNGAKYRRGGTRGGIKWGSWIESDGCRWNGLMGGGVVPDGLIARLGGTAARKREARGRALGRGGGKSGGKVALGPVGQAAGAAGASSKLVKGGGREERGRAQSRRGAGAATRAANG